MECDNTYSRHWNEGYVCLPNNFGHDIKSSSHFRILFLIVTFNYCNTKPLSLNYLKKLSGKSVNTIRAALKEFEQLGYIEKVGEYSREENRPNVYRITNKYKIHSMIPLNGLISLDEDDEPISKIDSTPISKIDSAPISKIDSKELTIKKNNKKDKRKPGDVETSPHPPAFFKKSKKEKSKFKTTLDDRKQAVMAFKEFGERNYSENNLELDKYLSERLNDGYTIDQIIQVIEAKCKEWCNEHKMRMWIKPSTILGYKFESYFNDMNDFNRVGQNKPRMNKLIYARDNFDMGNEYLEWASINLNAIEKRIIDAITLKNLKLYTEERLANFIRVTVGE